MKELTNLINWPGARITGTEGTKVLCHFSNEVDQASLTSVNNHLNTKHLKFKPWMTRAESYIKFKVLDEVERINLSTNQAGLELLKGTLSENAEVNLRAIDPNAQENVTILLRDNDDYLRFEDYLNRYIGICDKINPTWNVRLNSLVHEINPIAATDNRDRLREDGSGLSTLLYRKAIFLSLPKDREQAFFEFALNLSHELGHQALMVYENIDDIVRVDQHSTTYSVIRKTHRPAIQSFHALCATVYMLEFIIYAKGFLNFSNCNEYIKQRTIQLQNDLKDGIEAIQKVPLTHLGDQLIAEFKAFLFFSHKELNVE